MTISIDSLIDFFGTQDTVTAGGGTSSVTNNSFSVTADIVSWVNDDDAPSAVFVMKVQSATVFTDGSKIRIYARKMDVDSTNDSPKPSIVNFDQFIGEFTVDGDVAINTDAYLVTNWLTLPNHKTSQPYEYYFENKTGQTMTAGWTVKVTPSTRGPHA